MNTPKEVQEMVLYAWVGEDELGRLPGFGLKQGVVPAGTIPMVSVSKEKLDKYWSQAELQAKICGNRIRLCRFVFAEVIRETQSGE